MPRIARAGALIALALLTALALAGPAAASKPRHDRGKGAHRGKSLPKHWSKHYKVKRAAADPDRDGLTNWGEYRARTKPKRADSDRDRLGDALEDYDRDGLDNGSEEDARTDPRVKDTDRNGVRDGAEDPDRDRLANAAEDRTGNKARNPDTDADGRLDGDENAGVVQAFDGQTLTIALAAGGTLTGVLDADSFVSCDDERGYEDATGSDDDDGGDDDEALGDDDSDLDEEAALGDGDDPGDEDLTLLEEDATLFQDADDEAWGDEACYAGLAPGTAVHEAEVEDGVFTALELVTPAR
jgi:hypothetical protein